MELEQQYYNKFLPFIVDYYKDTLKDAKPGHCMKITGFAFHELKKLIPMLRPVNKDMQVYIISEEVTGPDFAHPNKIVELRNKNEFPLLALVPTNYRTSSEDSFGDATFKLLDVKGLDSQFYYYLDQQVPDTQYVTWKLIKVFFDDLKIDWSFRIKYYLFLEENQWDIKAWGNGLYLIGLIPDSKLLDDMAKLSRRLLYNIRCADLLCNFSINAADKAMMLPLNPGTIQKDIVIFFREQRAVNDRIDLCQRIYESYPQLNFSEWSIDKLDNPLSNVIVTAELMPGKNPEKELVKDISGDYIIQIPYGKKSKVKVKITFEPTPEEMPEMKKYAVEIFNYEGFEYLDTIRQANINSKGKSKTITLNINNAAFDDGTYFLRVHALDADGLILDNDNPFKVSSVQEEWEEFLKLHKDGNKEELRKQFQKEHSVMTVNETMTFTIKNLTEDDTSDDVEVDVTKRNKPENVLQAYFNYCIEQIRKDETVELPTPEISEKTEWKEGSLNNTYTFEFGNNAQFAYQIQIAKKLLELERAFYKHATQLGHVDAEVSGNPTDSILKDWSFKTIPADIQINPDLITKRNELFNLIQGSTASESGVVNTFPVYKYSEHIKSYVLAYSEWLHSVIDQNPSDDAIVAIQNIDTVLLRVEMPDGSINKVKLISPIHPLRLAWLANIYDLFRDWEEKTLANPEYKKTWYHNLDYLFMGNLPMEVSPLVLVENALKEFQYVGELTFGWGFYAQPTLDSSDVFASESRQLKSYVSSLLNISREKMIDSDVSFDLVYNHIYNYTRAHKYTKKLVINIFNAGDANVFADALVKMEQQGYIYDYEIRLFADDSLIQPGEALRQLINPDNTLSDAAEAFSLASKNRLFPKLRFSVNSILDFIKDHKKYQAHLSFLVNPFPVKTGLVQPDRESRSFFLNAVMCRSVVNSTKKDDNTFVWSRYFAEKSIPSPTNEFANDSISLFANLQYFTGKIISSKATTSLPATCLSLQNQDQMLLSFVHDVSDWVVTFDRNMGPEFYDLPNTTGSEMPYLLDYVPGQERTGISSFLTTKPTSEIIGLMQPHFRKFNIDIQQEDKFKDLLEDVRTVSSSILMQINSTQNKAFEVLGITFTKRLLKKKRWSLLNESFMIPIDLHKELFKNLESQNKERADILLVNLDVENREIIFQVIEVKCRQSLSQSSEEALEQKMLSQINNTIEALEEHFVLENRLDRELKTIELASLLSFYVRRSARYGVLDNEIAQEYLAFLDTLNDGYDIRFKRLGIIYNLAQVEKQRKENWPDASFYIMGKPAIDDILSDDKSMDTDKLDQYDKEFLEVFEESRKERLLSRRRGQKEIDDIIKDEHKEEDEDSVKIIVNVTEDDKDNDKSENKNDLTTQPDDKDDIASVSSSQNTKETDDKESKVTTGIDKDKEDVIIDDSVFDNPIYFVDPNYDIMIGDNKETAQFGILGKTIANNRKIAVDLAGCNTISLFGVQGAGKSYTIGTVTEMVLKRFSNVNNLKAPLASVIFHYSDSMDYAPEFTSMVYPNDEARQLAMLKEKYGAEPDSIKDVILLAPESKVDERKAEYPDIEVHPIGFDSNELQVKDWMFLLGAMGNDSTYIRELKLLMRKIRNDLSLKNIRRGVASSSTMTQGQKGLATQRLNFAEEYINDGIKLQDFLKPGRLIIVDLRDEFIEKDEALGLFVVMLNIFSSVMQVDGKAFNKFIVFDEAHKYMNNKELVGSITTAIREMRHKGVSIMIASQDPMSLPNEIIELSSIVILHRFNSPAWVKHVQKSITPLGSLTPSMMSGLKSGEAYLWAGKATDENITAHPIKIEIRPRVTKHGGDTISAVK